MSARKHHHFWWRCRIYFRHFRITVWLVVLMLLCALIYMDHVGLPDFVKRPLLDQLRARGVDLQFSRLRLRWHHGFVADDVSFCQTNYTKGPQLRARQIYLQVNPWELAKFRLQVDGLGMHQGRLEWPTNGPNSGLTSLNIENIEAQLQLRTNDEWSVDDFRAHFAGADFTLLANVANASALRDWAALRPSAPSANAVPLSSQLQRLARHIESLSFSTPPQLRLVLDGNARDPRSFSARFTLTARDAGTPWGAGTNILLVAQFLPGYTNSACRAKLHLGATSIQTKWAQVQNVNAAANLVILTNHPVFDESLSWWTNAMPLGLDWNVEADSLQSEKIHAEEIVCAGGWFAPELVVTNLHAALGGGVVNAGAKLDIVSRLAQFNVISTADPRSVEELLTPKTREWMDKYSWKSPPHLRGSGSLVLPAWTNRAPDWRGEVRPTLCLAGEFAATNGAYLGIPADWATSHVTYTNMVWNLPDLTVRGPGGAMQLAHTEYDRTKDYHWNVKGVIDPNVLRPLLSTNMLRGFDLVSLAEPIAVDGDIMGRLYDHDLIGFKLRVGATNFSVRGQSADTFETDVQYTNRVLELIEPHLMRGAQHMSASGVRVDFNERRIYFTNGFSMAEPHVVANAIGPKTAHALEPYRFAIPPVAHVDGHVSLKSTEDAGLRVVLEGGPFEWSKFKVPHIAGDVHWMGTTLLLTNVQMDFYGGSGAGNAVFNFEPGTPGSEFSFSLTVSNANLHLLMADLSTNANRLEGLLSGSVLISDANSANWHSWNGLGNVRLRDGFIWDIPVFGVLSPALDSIVPGLGNSPATEGRAGFVITNGVIYSDSLNIRSPMMRLKYDGTLDFNGRLNQKVEAELFRDSGVLARIIGVAFAPVTKLFEYKVTGTLSKPKLEPLYFLPKLLFLPLHPIRTIEGLMPGTKSTDAPPEMQDGELPFSDATPAPPDEKP